jgi:uncharacterized membrane protein YgdD (TMEM256/DUF423 family)
MNLRPSTLRWIAAVMGGCGVLLGAFGAHALRDGFTAAQLALWQTAVSYLFWHVLAALLALQVDAVSARLSGRAAAALMMFGVAVFSGTLFALALSAPRWVGAITPVGGVAMIAGWLALAWVYAQTNASGSAEPQ